MPTEPPDDVLLVICVLCGRQWWSFTFTTREAVARAYLSHDCRKGAHQ